MKSERHRGPDWNAAIPFGVITDTDHGGRL